MPAGIIGGKTVSFADASVESKVDAIGQVLAGHAKQRGHAASNGKESAADPIKKIGSEFLNLETGKAKNSVHTGSNETNGSSLLGWKPSFRIQKSLDRWKMSGKSGTIRDEVRRYREFIEKLDKTDRYLIHPGGTFIQRWDYFMMFLLVFTAIVTPFEAAFLPLDHKEIGLAIVNGMVDFAFLLDIIVNFSLVYLDKEGMAIIKRGMIARRYMGSFFAIDLISVLPFHAVLGPYVENILVKRALSLLRLLKLMRMVRMVRILNRMRIRIMISNSNFSLASSFCAVLVMLHWVACIWRVVPVVESETSQAETWTDIYRIEELAYGQQYVVCFEFALQLMVMTYSSAAGPATPIERLIAVIIMIVASCVYCYMIGSICTVLSNINPALKAYRQTSDLLKLYCLWVGAPGPMARELNNYYTQCSQVFPSRYFRKALLELSPQMQGMITHFHYKGLVESIPFFYTEDENEKLSFCRDVALRLKPVVFAPRERIFKQGSSAQKLYVVQKGMAAVHGKLVYRGGYFGVDSVLLRTDQPRYRFSAFSMSYIHCLFLRQSDLRRILAKGTCAGISSSVQSFSRRRSLRQLVRQVSLLAKIVHLAKYGDNDAEKAWKEAMAEYKIRCIDRIKMKDLERSITNGEDISAAKDASPAVEHNVSRTLKPDFLQNVPEAQKELRLKRINARLKQATDEGLIRIKMIGYTGKPDTGGMLEKAGEVLAKLSRRPGIVTGAIVFKAKSKLMSKLRRKNMKPKSPKRGTNKLCIATSSPKSAPSSLSTTSSDNPFVASPTVQGTSAGAAQSPASLFSTFQLTTTGTAKVAAPQRESAAMTRIHSTNAVQASSAALRTDFQREFAYLKREMLKDMAVTKADLQNDIAEIKSEVEKMFKFMRLQFDSSFDEL